MPPNLSLAIIGAGPAGCMLARLLRQQNIDVTTFEAEAGLDFRSQGGSLDLHVKTGQKALRTAGLFEEFEKHARYDGEAITICDKKLLSYIKQGASKNGMSVTGRPEIDRPKLRELLYNSLAPDTVRWNHKVTSIDQDLTIHFASGEAEVGFALIDGADGAWSKVRPLLSDKKPFYSGIGGHAISIPDAEATHPELYHLVNRGSLFSFSDGQSIMTNYMGDGSINGATWSVRPAGWQESYDTHDPEAFKRQCRQEYADWDSRLVAFTQAADEHHLTPRDLYMLPIGHRWDRVRGVTLIGDAAHLMTPFAGEGVNLALEDSLKLAEAIVSAAASPSNQLDQLDQNVAAFEEDMFKRATEPQQLTFDMMNAMFFTPGTPRSNIETYVLRAIEGEMGRWVTKLAIAPLVYAYFFVFKLCY